MNIPDGWKLVPIKPTKDMRAAAGRLEGSTVRDRQQWFAGDAWHPMVQHAPDYSPAPWTGEGLPPVGTFCEHQGSRGWENPFVVEVIGHKSFNGNGCEPLVIYTTESDVSFSSSCFFRPVRTPEQILADEREQAAIDLFLAIQPCGKWHKLDDGMKASYRAAITLGWAKKVAP